MPISLDELLKETQGNIIKPFARRHAAYLLVHFNGGGAETLKALRKILMRFTVSGAQQAAITAEWHLAGDDEQHGRTLGCFGLSASGYRRLGLDALAPGEDTLGAPAFNAGFGAQGYSKWNPDRHAWEPAYQERPIDAFLHLQDNWLERLNQNLAAATEALSAIATVHKEMGARIMMAETPNAGFEHFGFRDDRSTGPDAASCIADHRPDALFPHSAFGCYATFMKIEQDVHRFHEEAGKLAALSGAHTADQIEELAMGRRKNGNPLTGVPLTPEATALTGIQPGVCPYHAHARVMNRRDGTDAERIIRRGTTYGPGGEDTTKPSGLLFLSLQRTIFDFTILLGRTVWNMDPILSRSTNWNWRTRDIPERGMWDGTVLGQRWDLAGREISFPMVDMTTVRGGEFFFMPGLQFLKALAGLHQS